MNSFDKKVLDKLAKVFSDGNSKTWEQRNKYAVIYEWRLEDKKVECAVALARQEMLEKIEEMEKHNPYPSDIFIGVTEEGRIGKFAGKVWKDCLSDLRSFLQEEEKEGYK